MKKLFVLGLLFVNGLVFSQSVSYDTSFGVNGKVIQCSSQFTGYDIVDSQFQNNKILIGQTSSSTIFGIFRRYSIDGDFDTTFGNAGYYELSTTNTNVLQPNSNYHLKDIELQNDNKIVAVGFRESFQNKFCVARILENGGLDSSFNSTGFLEVDFGTVSNKATCLKIFSDNKILVGGMSGNQSEFFSMIKLNSDGTLDTSFGTLGKVQTSINGNQCLVNSMAVQTDGKIILAGYVLNNPNGYDFALARYLPTGVLDTGFGVNGKVITTINTTHNDIIYKVLVQGDNKIVVVGNEADNTGLSRIAVVRYLSDGTVDTSFGIVGKYISSNYDFATDAAIQLDGKIVVSGGNNDSGYSRFYVSRLNTTGSIDTDFQIDSQLIIPFSDNLSFNRSILIQSDNKIVNVGSLDNTPTGCSDFSIALVRLNPGTLSTNEFNDNEVVVYPNPTSSFVGFDNSVNQFTKATLFNYLGQEVALQSLNSFSEEQIDISSFANGVYLLKLSNETSNTTVKVVKK
jgi:uncharacterized delta-60 repeat protein